MSLFDATVTQVVKDVSDKTLVPVANRSAADYCKILSLVERKTKSWHLPWKSSYKYIPAELTLNDILIEPVDVKNLLHSTVLFQNYESTPSFHKTGKIGGKIADEFEVDVSVNETMQVSLKLGNVMKQEILWQKLYETVNGKMVKTNHPLIKTINSNSKRSLFLIGMVVTSGSTSSLDKDTAIGGDIDVSPHVSLHLNTNGSSESKQHRQYIIPLGTTLAYCCYKLKIDNNGALNVQLGDDLTDGPLVNQKETFEADHIQHVLSGLLTNKVSNDLINLLRNILKTEPTCAFKLNVVIESAIDCLEADIPCKITVHHLLKLFPDDCSKDCFKFLEMTGFQIDKEKNKVICPENLDLLTSLNVLLDNLSEMSNEQIQMLVGCDVSHKSGILSAIQNVIKTKDGSKSDVEFSEIFADNHPAARFLRSIGLHMVRSDAKIGVEYLPKHQSVLQLGSSFIAVHGMCSV